MNFWHKHVVSEKRFDKHLRHLANRLQDQLKTQALV
jgi:hypothetical protein